jgi:hypothetical protein
MNTTQKITKWILATLREAAWAPVSVVVVYMIGFVLGWYDIFPPLDIPTHFVGGVAIAYFYLAAIRNSQKYVGEIPSVIQKFLAFTTAGTTTILWEFLEFLSDYFLDTQHIFGLNDTIKDMFFGLAGALLVSMFYRKR